MENKNTNNLKSILDSLTKEQLSNFTEGVKAPMDIPIKPKSNKEYSDKMKKYLKERKKK